MLSDTLENSRFKSGYIRHLELSLAAAIMIHLLAFYFFPEFSFHTYPIPVPEHFEVVKMIHTDIPEKPDEIPPPDIPVPTDDPAEAADPSTVAPTIPPAAGPRPARISGDSPERAGFIPFDEKPVLIHSVTPDYPPLPRSAGIEGDVVLKVVIDRNGKVIDVSVIRSEASRALMDAAVAAAMQFRFRPAKQRMQPVRSTVVIPVRFRLH